MDSNLSFSPIDIGQTEAGDLSSPQREPNEKQQNGAIPLANWRFLIASRQRPVYLFHRQVLGQ
jgi:hypothetical protein